MANVKVTIDPARLAEVLRSPQGPVVRDLSRRAERVRQRSRSLVGVSESGNRQGGHLRDRIVVRLGFRGANPVALVIAEAPYSLVHHQGSRAHLIRPRSASGVLAFVWPKASGSGPASGTSRARVLGGGYVFFKQVHHPGTKPNHFLTDALPDAR